MKVFQTVIKADIEHTHDDRYYTETEVDTVSGILNDRISAENLWDREGTTVVPHNAGDTISGTGDIYCDILHGKIKLPIERTLYVAKNGNDSNTGSIGDPFLTIQAGIDYAKANYTLDKNNRVEINVAPGTYTEQLSSSYFIIINGCSAQRDIYEKGTILENEGTSLGTYPLRGQTNAEKYFIFNMDIRTTTTSGIIGPITGAFFQDCQFTGKFIENDTTDQDVCVVHKGCYFLDQDGYGFKLEGGPYPRKRRLQFLTCRFQNITPTFTSTYAGSYRGVLVFENHCLFSESLYVVGDWKIAASTSTMAKKKRLVYGNEDGICSFIRCTLPGGLHFTKNPKEFVMQNTSFFVHSDDPHLPEGEGDITADTTITNAIYENNLQYNGIDGEIQIRNAEKKVGPCQIDSYKNITEAIKASSFGDNIKICTGTFTENIVVPNNITLMGAHKGVTILTSTSGITLTLSGSENKISSIADLTISSSTSGTGVVGTALKIQKGTYVFKNCEIASTATETYGHTVTIDGGKIKARDLKINYTNKISGGGEHGLFEILNGEINLYDSILEMSVADTSDNVCMLCDTTKENIEFSKNNISINTTSSGTTSFIKQKLRKSKNCILYNHIVLSGTQGTGVCYLLQDDSEELGSVSNTISVTGFDKNYLGNIENNTHLKSHFDNITAADGVTGSGVYSFVNSPNPGDLRISGAYINMHDNDLIVAKRGGEFTSLKAALNSITDNSSTNRYNIHIHSGFYIEDNPIELKPYVYIYGEFKHNPRIIPANPLEHLFTIPLGYCTTDLGELTLQAPAGDSSHQVYVVYAGPGCKPIAGIYQCLFLGDNINYCNSFYCEESLSGYHTVNCMAYGSFNRFANMAGGNWTDSGFIPESTTAMKYYLHMSGKGVAIIDLMRAKCPNFEKMFYINHADAELVVSDIYAEDQQTLTTGPNGGKIRMRGSTFHGKNTLNAGNITIHGGTFENNSYIEALTGNLEYLSITSTKNKNTNTYCVKVTGGGNTEIYLGGGNIFDSPDGIQAIQLDGVFSKVKVEGVRQYNLSTLASGISHTFEHLPDLDYSRMVQIQAYPGETTNKDIKYLTTNESNYIQEDDSKTDFIDDVVTLSGIGSIAYGHWHMNETSGLYAYDSSGNSRDGYGEKIDANDWISGKLNNCLQFNNKDERIECGNIASWERTDVFTLECWVYTTNTQLQYVLSKMEDATGKGYGFYLDASNRPHFILRNATGNELDVYWDSSLSINTWYHVICTYNGTSIPNGCHIWVDNDDKSLTTLANTLSNSIINTAVFQMSGKDGKDNDELVGRIDEVVIYEQELTSTEIAYRYNNVSGTESLIGTYPTTKGYYVTTVSGSQLDISAWTNIGGIMFDETIKNNTQIKYLLSVDNRNSWNYWEDFSWKTGILSGIDTCGNSSSELECLDSNYFNDLYIASSGTLDIAASLKTTEAHVAPVLDNVHVVYCTAGDCRDRMGSDSIKITYVDTTHTKITNITNKPITGIKCNILKVQPH